MLKLDNVVSIHCDTVANHIIYKLTLFVYIQNVPCSFRERLNKFTKNWLVARTPNFRKYDLFLRKDRLRTYICGPYWKSLIRAYDIEVGDVVHFEYNEDSLDGLSNLFNVTVYKNNIEKAVVEETGIFLLNFMVLNLVLLNL
jgi:hypothetical protein